MRVFDIEYAKLVLKLRYDTNLNPDVKMGMAFDCVEQLIKKIEAINGQNINS